MAVVVGCQVSALKAGNQVWSSSYRVAALVATCSDAFTAVAYADATLHIHTPAGRK